MKGKILQNITKEVNKILSNKHNATMIYAGALLGLVHSLIPDTNTASTKGRFWRLHLSKSMDLIFTRLHFNNFGEAF